MNNARREESRGRAPDMRNANMRNSNMRDKAMAIAMKRKEEYLGARVPKALKERVIKKADEMNIPVSLLMRRLLEASFPEEDGAVMSGDISDAVAQADLASVNKSSANKSTINEVSDTAQVNENNYEEIVGWKLIEVNQDRSCERCKEPLLKGDEASLGFTPFNSGYVVVCGECKAQIIQS